MSGLMSRMQYRETEFDFISRLMEQEGMFYFFEHEQGKHTLVIADQPAAHPVLPVTPGLSYQPGDGSGAGGDVITRLASKARVASREIYDERLQLRDPKH